MHLEFHGTKDSRISSFNESMSTELFLSACVFYNHSTFGWLIVLLKILFNQHYYISHCSALFSIMGMKIKTCILIEDIHHVSFFMIIIADELYSLLSVLFMCQGT